MTLLRLLVNELSALGLIDVSMDEHGYVMATIPSTTTKLHVPVDRFSRARRHIAGDAGPRRPADRAPRATTAATWCCPTTPRPCCAPADDPSLAARIGHDIVTASGSTLLGADDKAGVAEIVAAVEYLMAHPEIPHGAVRVAFTPDEEIGRGANHFDVGRFGALCAYTIDGGGAGELEWESFSADAMTVTFKGFNTHPGYAKGRMVNAIKLAADFIARLPPDRLSPETTDGYDGYVHPYIVGASVERTSVRLLIRDFTTAGLEEKEALVEELARKVVADHPQRRRRDPDRRVLSQHAGHPGRLPRGRRVRARGNPAERADAGRATHPWRHGWVAAIVHGPADAEHLRRRAQLPFAARMGLRTGHGQGCRDDRQSVRVWEERRLLGSAGGLGLGTENAPLIDLFSDPTPRPSTAA